MSEQSKAEARAVKAVHGLREFKPDPHFEIELAEYLRTRYSHDGLFELYARFAVGDNDFDVLLRRVLWRAGARRFGHAVHIGSAVGFKHLETFEIGNGVFIGAQTYIQGRFDGKCIIGDHVWIGPQSYFDARDLVIEDYVGWGPGARVLGSAHIGARRTKGSGLPHTGAHINVPIIQTELEIRPVRVGAWADIGTSTVVLPGVTIGKGSVVGAGAVVTKDVPPFAVVAGVPARFLYWREGYKRAKSRGEK